MAALSTARTAAIEADAAARNAVRVAGPANVMVIAGAVRVAGAVGVTGSANVMEIAYAVRVAADAAVRALDTAERVLAKLPNSRPRVRGVDTAARPPGVLARRLLAAACALLPAGDRARYGEEWLSLLTEVTTRRARAGHVLSILGGAPRQAWTLRRPLKSSPPA